MYKLRQGDPDGGSSGHRDEDVGAEEGRGHCCSAIHDDDDNEDEEGWLDGGERVEELRKRTTRMEAAVAI